jgi:voltage-gated potassium channel
VSQPVSADPAPSQIFTLPRRAVVSTVVRSGIVVAILCAIYAVIPIRDEGGWAFVAAFGVGAALFVYVVIRQLRAIVAAEHPQLRAIEALTMASGVWVLFFSLLYLQAAAADPTAFSEPVSRVGAVYFTVTVLSTVGFGDITAVTDGARLLVTAQMVGNLFIIGVAVKIITHVTQSALARRSTARAQSG